jgi:hypothetical protein
MRDDRARIGFGRSPWQGFAAAVTRAFVVRGAFVAIILERKVLAPDHGIFRVIGQFDDAEKWILGLLLALENVHQERDADERNKGRGADKEVEAAPVDGRR